MTNRDILAESLQQGIQETVEFFNENFGCPPVNNLCGQCKSCDDCWRSWLESEVSTNDYA